MKSGTEEIRGLVEKLKCTHPSGCDEVRGRLIGIGAPAVPQLVRAFASRELDEKIQAAKALGGIGSKESIMFLIEGMRSDDFETRYAAIQGLPLSGQKAIIPLMREIIEHGSETTFRSGAHAVLHQVAAGGYVTLLTPVLAALEGPEPELKAPLAAHEVLEKTGQAV